MTYLRRSINKFTHMQEPNCATFTETNFLQTDLSQLIYLVILNCINSSLALVGKILNEFLVTGNVFASNLDGVYSLLIPYPKRVSIDVTDAMRAQVSKQRLTISNLETLINEFLCRDTLS